MRLTADVGSRLEISFTTRTSRVGSDGIIGVAGVAVNLVHHPGKLDGVRGAESFGQYKTWMNREACQYRLFLSLPLA